MQNVVAHLESDPEEEYAVLDLFLSKNPEESTAITKEFLMNEVNKLVPIKKVDSTHEIVVLEQKQGDICKVNVTFSDGSDSNKVKNLLDKTTLGQTTITVRAFVSNDDEAAGETAHTIPKVRKPLRIHQDDFNLMNNVQQDEEMLNGYRFLSDDPNLLNGFISEIREELGTPSHFSHIRQHNLGGDAKIIDGPHDYAFNKLNSQGRHPSNQQPYLTPETNNYPQYMPSNNYMQNYQGYHGNQRQNQGSYNLYGRKDFFSQGNFENSSKSSISGGSYHSVGRQLPYPQMSPYHNSNYGQMQGYPNSSEMLRQVSPDKWSPSQDGELTTSSGSDKKKLAAQNKIKSMIDQKISPVVHVKGLESDDISVEIVASLFSNFGNIKQILYLKKKQTALVEYLDQDSASVSREMLNNLTFFGSQLKVSYSTYNSIEENLATSNNPEKFRDVFTPNPKGYRFKEYKKISINPPSKVLHLSNIAKEVYNEKGISEIFSKVSNVKKVKLLNSADQEKCMALIELDSLESALTAISTLHNKVFYSR